MEELSFKNAFLLRVLNTRVYLETNLMNNVHCYLNYPKATVSLRAKEENECALSENATY